MRSAVVSILCLASLAASGCDSTPSGAGGDVRDLAVRCKTDRMCGGALPFCDIDSGRCVSCLDERQCPVGTICRGGACVRGCSLAHGCDDAGVCDVDAGLCRVCSSDSECAQPAPRCDVGSGRCVACLPANDNCAAGQVCTKSEDTGDYACAPGCKADGECRGDGGAQSGMCCNDRCIDPRASNANCGACGVACSFPAACCGAACNDFQNDVANCGGCQKACALPNAVPDCRAGKCAVASCAGGFADCNAVALDGCEVDTGKDPRNCGGCGMLCMVPNAFAGCDRGCTVSKCKVGFADCDGAAPNGCEVNLTADPANCGACGTNCVVAHAAAGCIAGACTIASCNGAWADCDKMAANGCEVDTGSDLSNCGGCGKACGGAQNGSPACAQGACAVASCNGTFADCDQQFGNGCEVDTATDPAHCGGCAMACMLANAVAGCAMGMCTVASCAGAFADCNLMPGDGCEVDTAGDPANCGGCRMACAAIANGAPGCAMGACTVGSCAKNFGDCDGKVANGCEANLQSDNANCGACAVACNAAQICLAGKCAPRDYGGGGDGPLTVANGQTVTLGAVRTTAAGTAGMTTLTVGATNGFGANQSVLIHQTQGMGAGAWEMATVASVGNGALTFVLPLANSYTSSGGNNHAQVIVVPQYTDVNVAAGGTLTAAPWDGTTGGILALQANGTASIAGNASMDARGFRGTSHACLYRCKQGFAGESPTGPGAATQTANGSGGGGGTPGQDCAAGGGGGYNQTGSAGANGTVGACAPNPHLGGAAGGSAGVADLVQALDLGGAGGEGGADEDGGSPGAGGNGGGVIVLAAKTLVVSGSVSTAGGPGAMGGNGCGGGGCGMGGGGGGAGGAVRIVSDSATLGTGLVSAVGASGAQCTCGGNYPGGAGSNGRVAVKAKQIAGTTLPTYFGG